ncbi:collagen alpha-4(VI) chain-like [Liolophura sinensis]|uniref:collagen alpha-4(VI) chain-like n=1 Tax=Liolophura sinensis TaxID=3198878 RepID=UPI003158F434
MLSVAFLAVLSAIATLGQGGTVKSFTEVAPKTHTDHDGTLCPYKADIVILMDASSSIGPENYLVMKNFLRGVVQHFDVGQDNVRVGLITFNFGALVEFNLNQFSTKEEVLQAFDHVQGIHEGTATHRALKYAREISFTAENGDRPDIPNVAILLTDGQSTHPDKTATEQALLKAAGVRVFAIGIGWVDEAELRLIASDPVDKYFHYVKDFSGLDEILAEFQQTSCAEITRPIPTTPLPTTTLAPITTTKKPCPYAADVMILMDASSSIGPENFEKMRQFLLGVIGHFEIGEDRVRVGLIIYNHGARFEFYLNTYHTKEEVVSAFAPLQGTEVGTATHAALRIARETGFTSEHGDRPGIPNIAILITDGRSTHPDQTASEQALLKAAGVRVFAIGIGWTDENELRLISSDPDERYFHYVDNFDGLQEILGEFQDTSCNGGTVKSFTEVFPKTHTDHDGKMAQHSSSKCTEELITTVLIPLFVGTLCPYKADIVILMDASSSIGPENYLVMKNFLRGVVQHFDVGQDNVRVGLITFNFGALVEFNLNQFSTKEEVLQAFDHVQGIHEGTATHRALKYAREISFTAENGDRPDIPNVAILLTDGQSTHPDKTATEQALLKAAGVRVFAIGIGWVDEAELRLIASDPVDKYFHYVKDFSGLDEILAEFQQTSCAEITRPIPTTPLPTTTLAPITTTKKPCPYAADVMILMDASSSIGPENFEKMRQFLLGVIGHFEIGEDRVRVGLIIYNHGARFEFYLNTYHTKEEVVSAFAPLQGTEVGTATHAALRIARETGFTSEHGDRPGIPNIAILITDGRSTHPDQTASEQALLKAAGVRVFAIGIGWTDENELRLISSDPDERYFHYVDNFDGLQEILGEFQDTSCNDITRPNTNAVTVTVTPAPASLKSGNMVLSFYQIVGERELLFSSKIPRWLKPMKSLALARLHAICARLQ